MAGCGRPTTGMDPLSTADMVATLGSIISIYGTHGILLDELLCEFERLTGVPQATVKLGFTPESFVLFLETELGIVYEPIGSDRFRLTWGRAHQSAPPRVTEEPASATVTKALAVPLAAPVPQQPSFALQPCASSPTPHFRPQHGLSENKYVAVYVGHVYNVDDFYVQLRGNETSLRLEQLMNALECVYEGGLSKSFALNDVWEGMPCAAPFVYEDGHSDWHRAVVTAVNCEPHQCRVFYVDYGTQRTVARTSLRALKSEFFELPTQAIRASLGYVLPLAPSGWTTAAANFFLELTSGDKVFMCKLIGPQEGDKFSVALCDTSGDSEVFVQDLLVEQGHAMPHDGTALNTIAKPNVPPQLVLPTESDICAGGEPPINLRLTFGRGRALPSARASPVNDAVQGGAVSPTTSSVLVQAAHFQQSHQDSAGWQAKDRALESSGKPPGKQHATLTSLPLARPEVRAECADFDCRMAALKLGVAPGETALAVPAAESSASLSLHPGPEPAPSQHPAQPATRLAAQRNSPFHQPLPAADLCHVAVPAARTPPPSCSAVSLGVAQPAATYLATQSSADGSATTAVLSVGGASGRAASQQLDDVMCDLEAALEEEPILLDRIKVERLSTGHRLRVVKHNNAPYVTVDGVCELLHWPHGRLLRELIERDSDFPRLLTLKRTEHRQLFDIMAAFNVPGLCASTLDLKLVRLQDVPVVLNVFGSGVSMRPLKEEVYRVLALFDAGAPYWGCPDGKAELKDQLVSLRARKQQLHIDMYQGSYLEGTVDELSEVEAAIAALERRMGTDEN